MGHKNSIRVIMHQIVDVMEPTQHRLRNDVATHFALDKAASLTPAEPAAFLARSNIRYKHGRVAEALQDINRAIELDPKNPLDYWERGRIYFDKGDRESANRDFERAQALFSEIEAQ